MDAAQAIGMALDEAGISAPVAALRSLTGGCIHQVYQVELADGRRFVAKTNRAASLGLFQEECQSLQMLAETRTVVVPHPLAAIEHDGFAVLLMTHIQPPGVPSADKAWRQFGAELAALHDAPVEPRYGFEIDNHIGSTLQPNSWRDDWVEFNAINRLGFQLQTACEQDLLTSKEARAIESVIHRLDRFIPRRPKPALLHGDLWSGNALAAVRADDQDRSATYAVIDPACSIGDGWADIAMMRLFGGFSESCFEAYVSLVKDHDQIDDRLAVYQLYHVLNHLNIFGRGYAAQAMALARRLEK